MPIWKQIVVPTYRGGGAKIMVHLVTFEDIWTFTGEKFNVEHVEFFLFLVMLYHYHGQLTNIMSGFLFKFD